MKLGDLPAIGVGVLRQAEARGQDVRGAKARFYVLQCNEAAQEQPGANQKRQGESDFRDHQPRSDAAAACAAFISRAASLMFPSQ